MDAKAAVLLYALAKSQACVDGNKRVALLLVDAFLRMNGYVVNTMPGELADQILQVASSDVSAREQTIRDLTLWFRPKLARLDEED